MTLLPVALADALRTFTETDTRPVVLIDGGAGAGKSTLARQLGEYWPLPGGVQVVSLDELYPGWGGMATGSLAVPDLIRGTGFTTWDWRRDAPGPTRPLDPSVALIVEGCGALTPASRALAALAVWIELDEATRRGRALARDGAEIAAHWQEWEAQEAAHWRAHRPWELADLTLGTPPEAS
ncbi:MAG: cobalt ABC transporter [Propionicimonas sp.]